MAQHHKFIITKDGSHTLKSSIYGAEYHSIHGAVQESIHVFIKTGLHSWIEKHKTDQVQIFEMGLGTGLNALLTLLEAEKMKVKINYTAIEAYPIDLDTALQLNYLQLLGCEDKDNEFKKIHSCEFDSPQLITEYFILSKFKRNLLGFDLPNKYDLIYYDAFAPNDQPELWSVDVFEKLFTHTNSSGILLTYCAKGDVKRALKNAGWTVEKVPGPPGKREMIRAIKI